MPLSPQEYHALRHLRIPFNIHWKLADLRQRMKNREDESPPSKPSQDIPFRKFVWQRNAYARPYRTRTTSDDEDLRDLHAHFILGIPFHRIPYIWSRKRRRDMFREENTR